jgi:hypothetical protein
VLHPVICSSHIADTCFRVLVKMAARDASSSYTWHEMTFCSRWIAGRCTILCIGASSSFKELLKDAHDRLETALPLAEPYSLHLRIVEAIITMHDSSVWHVRDIVRSVEKASMAK